ncbi:kinase-like domain-containing protein [Desarmillaria tabescens]|uniref:Kinase-like domain-containing protein n=1 Tax=Armillaria tabescens TaxID=1929756 RepID=A0AA39TTI7_ARMTA|nr:kinase-like domain-containing protein [Desarmillaria tabescens]KAK0463124.1 kinase-like domain-containing protein [Desarmillaria tabescens]
MHSDAFDVIPYEDIKGDWVRLGSGSFGNVYKGKYLGIDVAIKEVLPSTEYDVGKYFEREWRLMKESRHPNISKPFPWRLRLSFATDIARALAYLHARKCIHRDLKGENLLVTSNGRLKITDFGFARIAARNEEELKRLTFCGTDSYMSPEVLLGDEFDLPTDIFSLGIILCEIVSRQLADDRHFKRTPPTFDIDVDEIRKLASPGCPPDMIALCIDCLATDPAARPVTRDILEPRDEDAHVGSIKFMTGGKRPSAGPRIPSFGMGVGKDIRSSGSSTDDSDDELMEAVMGLSSVGVNSDWSDSTGGKFASRGNEPLLNTGSSEYSTTVIRSHPSQQTMPPSLSSILTIRASPNPNETPDPVLPASNSSSSSQPSTIMAQRAEGEDLLGTSSIMSIDTLDSYHTAAGVSAISSALATEGGSTIRTLNGNYVAPLVHRFTLLKPGGAKPKKNSISGTISPPGEAVTWNPLDLIFSSGLFVAKCDVCTKRLGWKPILECDDCGLKAHIKCGEVAPRDCGLRPSYQDHTTGTSPVSKVKQGGKASPTR